VRRLFEATLPVRVKKVGQGALGRGKNYLGQISKRRLERTRNKLGVPGKARCRGMEGRTKRQMSHGGRGRGEEICTE